MDSFTFLAGSQEPLQPVYVLHGDEDFLKRQVLQSLRGRLFQSQDEEIGYCSYAGDKATFSAIVDELKTLPFLCSRRLVVVDNADPFITQYRAALEKYVTQPATAGILVLDVRSWTSTTRLAKLVNSDATIVCKSPPPYKIPDWCVRWAKTHYAKKLSKPAAQLLVELAGDDMGVLDQEIAKLTAYAGKADGIDVAEVDLLAGSGRAANTFKIFDALAEGRRNDAMSIIEKSFEQGDDAIRILGAVSYQLRRLVQVARLSQQGLSFYEATEEAGIPGFARSGCEKQLRQLGRARIDRIYDWLLETDQGMKGASPFTPRLLLERLIVRLS